MAKGEKTGGRKPGTPNLATSEIKVLARAHGAAAIDAAAKLAGLVIGDDGKPIGVAHSEQARIAALNVILERGYGKATQPLANEAENPVEAPSVIRIILVGPEDIKGERPLVTDRHNGRLNSIKRYQA